MTTPTTAKAILTAIAVSLVVAPNGPAANDQQLESLVKSTYVFQTYLKDDEIHVEATNGVVQLTGTVANAAHNVLARATAMSLPGVQQVDDRLQATVPSAPPRSEDWIQSMVRFALQFHTSINPLTKVAVHQGIVTLTGVATSGTEKELAGACARGIAGVVAVANKLTVIPSAPPPVIQNPVDDASITAAARVVLLLQRTTSSRPVEISVTDGLVTVSGVAKSPAEKNLVTLLLQDLPGVTGVRNQLVAGG